MLLGRLYRIFLRYAERNLTLTRSGLPLTAEQGTRLGVVEQIVLRDNRLVVEGWTQAGRIGLILNRTRQWGEPHLDRPGSDERGFSVDVPFDLGTPELHLEQNGETHVIALPSFSAGQVARGRARLWGPYVAALIGLTPVIWRWKRGGDLGAREIVKERLGLVPASGAVEMSGDVLLAPPAPLPRPHDKITIVLPVYNAFEVLQDCLARVAAHTDLDWHLVVIEDASPDPQVAPWLRAWCADPAHADRVTLLENETNKGFITSVNRGFEAALAARPACPVVLLNSDALVPVDWASRLIAPLSDPAIASVTPMSNDAEIFTVPVICHRNPLPPGRADVLDAAAARLIPGQGWADVPTGVGFCMAMAPQFLAKLPRFDTWFGRGYGEENDWCQKVVAMGGRHVAIPNLFVEHRGGESFGSATKQQLLERNVAEVSRRYPRYDQEVQTFIRDDPMNTARLALGLVWAGARQDTPVPVYLAHALGGGAESWLKRRIGADIAEGGSALVIRVGKGHRWQIELHCEGGITQGLTNDEALLRLLVAHLPRRRIVYSNGVFGQDSITLPELLLALSGRGETPLSGGPQPIEIQVHDFFPVSPSYTLLGADGFYHGVPRAGGPLADDPAHAYERPGGVMASLADWQQAWGALLSEAEEIVVFSQNSAEIIAKAYPQTQPALVVRPHPLLAQVPRVQPGDTGKPVIGVLGNIGYQKGITVLQQLARDLAGSGQAGLVVLGQTDPNYPLCAPAQVHGNYELRDLPNLVARYGIQAWLIPSIWPETFSFTTHEALATGLPVFAFDLGAQGATVAQAVAQGAPGGVLPLPTGGGASMDLTSLLAGIADKDRMPT